MQTQNVSSNSVEGVGSDVILGINISDIDFDPYIPLGDSSFKAVINGLKVVVAAVSDAERRIHEGTMIKIMVPGNSEPIGTRLSQVDPLVSGETAVELVQKATGNLFDKDLFANLRLENERG